MHEKLKTNAKIESKYQSIYERGQTDKQREVPIELARESPQILGHCVTKWYIG